MNRQSAQFFKKALDGPDEAALVADLRKREDAISLVAVEDGEVAGHILFSPVQLLLDGAVVARGYGLAPMAVAADRQRSGIGGSLVEARLERLREDHDSPGLPESLATAKNSRVTFRCETPS
jgi:predicted N-acetyltransferase YhbS